MCSSWIIMVTLSILAGSGKALRDTVSFHWDNCIFARIKNKRWYRWFKSDYEDRPNYLIWFLWDAWHFGDTISYASLLALMVTIETWLQVAICAITMGVIFQLLYHGIFKATK